MLLSSILAVAIGLFILWVVLSFTTIQVQQWITMLLGKRARVLEDAIHEMFANPNLKAQFYEHPVIRGMTVQRRTKPSALPHWIYRSPLLRGFTRTKRYLPSYITSKQFASTLFDIVLIAGTESSLIQQGILRIRDDLQNDRKSAVPPELIQELNLLSDYAFGAAATEAGTAITQRSLSALKAETGQFLERFSNKYPGIRLNDQARGWLIHGLRTVLEESGRIKADIDDTLKRQRKESKSSALAKFRYGVAALSAISPELSQKLNTLILDAEAHAQLDDEAVNLLIINIQKWFDDTMDRVHGVFIRYSQTLALLIGTYLAVALNIDMISLSTYLWREAFIRQALLENVSEFELPQEEFLINPRQAMQDFRRQFIGLSLPPLGWTINESMERAAILDPHCQLFPRAGQGFGIPVFYSKRCISTPDSNEETNIFLKLAGFMITALATRLGAPLWFDITKKLVMLR